MRFLFFGRSVWQDPDWRIREQAAYQLRDQKKLLFLAIQDVSEEVRVAASKSLRDDNYRHQVVRDGFCEHARRLAVDGIRDGVILAEIVLDRSVPAVLRIAAGNLAKLSQSDFFKLASHDSEELIRAWAIEHLEKSDAVNSLFSTALGQSVRLALISKLTDPALLEEIAARDCNREIRARAINHLSEEPRLASLFAKLDDPLLRQEVIRKVKAPALLKAMLAEEDDDANRIYLVERLQDQPLLSTIALGDHHPLVRIAAAIKLTDLTASVAVITRDPDQRVRMAALGNIADESAIASVAADSDDEQIRWLAVERLQSESKLNELERSARSADTRWQAGRKIGHAPLNDLIAITTAWPLRRIAETESVPELQQMAVRLIKERRALEALTHSAQPAVSAAARQSLQVTGGPSGISFMPIPGRPYELSLFPVTQAQARALLGNDARWQGDDDLPATNLTPEEAWRLCAMLSELEGVVYRLPSFEEWLHATVTDDKSWYITPDSSPIKPWTLFRLHLQASGPRFARCAWPNPWGLLDALGNVAVWVDEQPGPISWIAYGGERDPLSAGGTAAPNMRDYAVAAGPHWADLRLRTGRWERLVRLANLANDGRDKVGVRLVRVSSALKSRTQSYRLVLESEVRWGLSREQVIDALGAATIYSREQLGDFFRVAPIVILTSSDYEAVRKLQSAFRRSGAEVSVTTRSTDQAQSGGGGVTPSMAKSTASPAG